MRVLPGLLLLKSCCSCVRTQFGIAQAWQGLADVQCLRTAALACTCRLISQSLSASAAAPYRTYSSSKQNSEEQDITAAVEASQPGLSVTDLPPYIILLRHGESAGLENLQEELKIPNHRVPLSAHGVEQSFVAGQCIHQLLHDAHDHHQQQQRNPFCTFSGQSNSSISKSMAQMHSSSNEQRHSSNVFMYTSPFLRCIQTAQHVVRALTDEQLVGFQEEVQLREQDWGNFQAPGQQAVNYEERIKYGRFFFRFPEGESAADVYDRMTMFQDHFVRDIAYKRFGGGTSVLMITHGLALRLFLMRWLHWTVDEFLQVHNPPTAAPVVLVRHCPQLQDSGSGGNPGVCVPPEAIKHCYKLSPESLAVLRGVSSDMGCGRSISSKEQLLAWRPYQKQVPPPPKMDPTIEAKVLELMNIGYFGTSN